MPRVERQKTWYSNPLTLEKAALLKKLTEEGANPLHLAMAFGVCYSEACRIGKGETWQGKQCRDCWRLMEPVSGSRSPICRECRRQCCNHCGGPKPAHRQSLRCMACDRENFRNSVRRHDRCCDCGEALPETRKSRYCYECQAADARLRQQFRNNTGKLCKTCGEPVPLTKSWNRNLCRECAKQHDALRRALSRRYCGICGKQRKDEGKGALCPPCQRDDDRIRRRGTTVTPEEHVALQARRPAA